LAASHKVFVVLLDNAVVAVQLSRLRLKLGRGLGLLFGARIAGLVFADPRLQGSDLHLGSGQDATHLLYRQAGAATLRRRRLGQCSLAQLGDLAPLLLLQILD